MTSPACSTFATSSVPSTSVGWSAPMCRASCAPPSWCPRPSRWTSCWRSSAVLPTTWRSWSTSTARWRGWPRSRICWRRSWARSATSSTSPTWASFGSGAAGYRIGGSFPIDQFNHRFGTELSEEDYHTVGGFVFGELGRAPRVGDSVGFQGLRFEVVGVEGSRITEVDVDLTRAEREPEPAEESS